MTVTRDGAQWGGTAEAPVRAREFRWEGRPVRVSAPVPAGVWRRGVEGNAADSRAGTDEYRERYRGMAETAWELAQRIAA